MAEQFLQKKFFSGDCQYLIYRGKVHIFNLRLVNLQQMHPILYFLVVIALGRIILSGAFPMRLASNGFKYVHVENDGSVRDFDKQEQGYLNEEFHPNDGARPYIKSNYWQKTPDKRLHGFLKRNRVPWWIKIKAK